MWVVGVKKTGRPESSSDASSRDEVWTWSGKKEGDEGESGAFVASGRLSVGDRSQDRHRDRGARVEQRCAPEQLNNPRAVNAQPSRL